MNQFFYATWHFMYSFITRIPQYRILYYVNCKHRIINIIIIIMAGLKALQAGLQSAKINYKAFTINELPIGIYNS